MAFTTQEHQDASDYIDTFRASSFERNLINLLVVLVVFFISWWLTSKLLKES